MSDSQSTESRYARAAALIADLLERLERGEVVELASCIAAHPDLERELRELGEHLAEVDRGFDAEARRAALERAEIERLLAAVTGQDSFIERYVIEAEVGTGGMGIVYRVLDKKLGRPLALKVIRGRASVLPTGKTPPVAPRQLSRFLNEARVTGQLDHPGIVPVHEVGVDDEGRAYFTMKLVRGQTLGDVLKRHASGDEDWTLPRVLGLIQRVCEAMAFAHERGVIHRDLKPANVMVGDFGEVYVMDWGLARRLADGDEPAATAGQAAIDEELSTQTTRTRDGDLVGTPAYMSPEQARGEITQMGPWSDVYSIGAMLYELIAGSPPYVKKGEVVSGVQILTRIVAGPPKALESRRAPPELIAISMKAIERELGDPKALEPERGKRYSSARQLAADIERFLTGRSVKALETGAWVETRKWIQRNKALSGALASVLVIAIAGATAFALKAGEADRNATDAAQQAKAAKQNEERALGQEHVATQKTNEVLTLLAIYELKELEEEADALWPAYPEMLPNIEAWLERARIQIEGRAVEQGPDKLRHPSLKEHEAKLADLRLRANCLTTNSQRRVDEQRTYEFNDVQGRIWSARLSQLVADLKSFTDEQSGGLYSSGMSEKHGWGVLKRAEFARSIEGRSSGAEAQQIWKAAIESIEQSPEYGGLRLSKQLGLLPIGKDPDSHLWEFAHLQTGDPARRDVDGRIVLDEKMGLVFVLIPAGTFWMGAQGKDRNSPNYVEGADRDESPVHEVELSAYFMSKYEMTQGQWDNFVGKSPSNYRGDSYSPLFNSSQKRWTALHPVEQVNWRECLDILGRLGLRLPSEAQWEYGARARTSSAYWTGDDPLSLNGAANLADAFGKIFGGAGWETWEKDLDDGNAVHAEIGTYRANAFGLHDVHGNVWEWCLDEFAYYLGAKSKDPVVKGTGLQLRVIRGGSFNQVASLARSTFRSNTPWAITDVNAGVRPARAVDPPTARDDR